MNTTIFRISAKSSAKSLGAAVAGSLSEGEGITFSCIGAAAINNACKACAIASNILHLDNKFDSRNVTMQPYFAKKEIKGKNITIIEFIVSLSTKKEEKGLDG